MKRQLLLIFLGLSLLASCRTTSDNGGQELKSNGTTGDSTSNMGTNNDQMTRTPSAARAAIDQGKPSHGDTSVDSSRTR